MEASPGPLSDRRVPGRRSDRLLYPDGRRPHSNDAGSTIHDTQALADAVQVAIDFAKEHADETLILVTGDHETGGLTIGFVGTDYDISSSTSLQLPVRNRARVLVIRCFAILQQPSEVNALLTGLLQFPAGAYPAQIAVYQYLKQHPWIRCGLSPFRRIRFVQFPILQFLKLGVYQTDRCVLRYHHF